MHSKTVVKLTVMLVASLAIKGGPMTNPGLTTAISNFWFSVILIKQFLNNSFQLLD